MVFGGDGARGSAHLGVVRALEEAGVPVDAVGGTSIGAVAAFMCAMGWDHDRRMAKLPLFFSTRLIIQPTVPLVSLSSGRRLQRRIVEQTDGRSVEDLWIRYFSVSTNLSQATQVVHERGDLASPCGPACPCPGSSRPSRRTATCWSTAACSATCPSTSCRRPWAAAGWSPSTCADRPS